MKAHPALTEEHEAWRDTVRRFVEREPLPRGTRAERIYREAKVMQIGGGSTEIMKDLAARQLGWES